MQKNTILIGLTGILIGILLAWLFIPTAATWMSSGGRMMARNADPSNGSITGSMDAHFIEQMIPHHEDAVLMAELALEKAQHPEIRQLSQDIQRTQRDEITRMQTWYRTWFGKEVPDLFAPMGHGMGSGAMHMGMMGDSTDLEALKTAAEFDRTFIEAMIPHHQMAVMMAQMLQRTSRRAELRELAQAIIEAQTREITSMRDWYRQWYGQ